MPFIKWRNGNHAKPILHPNLAERLTEIENQLAILRKEIKGNSFVIIEHADRVIIEKQDYSNHFGTLEVDNLEGQLNIGRNHQGSVPSDKLFSLVKNAASLRKETLAEDATGKPGQDETMKQGPKCNIHSRKSD